jgi:hypothetical protein
MGLGSGFSMMCTVEIRPLRKLSRCGFLLLAIRRPRWLIMCNFLMTH